MTLKELWPGANLVYYTMAARSNSPNYRPQQRRRQQFGVEGARLRTGSAHLCSYDACTRACYAIFYRHARIYMYLVVARFETYRVHAAVAAATQFRRHSSYFIGGARPPLTEILGGTIAPPAPPLPPPLLKLRTCK